jgi:hypothetical protein
LFFYVDEAEVTPLQNYRYSRNVVALGIESGTSVSAARNSDHRGSQYVAVNKETVEVK